MKNNLQTNEKEENGIERAKRYINVQTREAGEEAEEQKIKRDKNGKWIGSGNPSGGRDPRITALRHLMREHFDGVEKHLYESINQTFDAKLKAAAMKIWFDFSVPRLKGDDVTDMQKSARAALEKVGELPIAEQAKELLKMYYRAEISEYVLDITTRAISQAQHIHDEELERRLVELEKNSDER